MVQNIQIVSLSKGLLGMPFIQHELDLGVKRLEDKGIHLTFSKHAQDGLEAIEKHPEWRASDLLEAFQNKDVDMILCAIGGEDTYRLLPYLFENDELKKAVSNKIFLGFSDSTMNHLMLHKVGLPTFYGQSFLADVCELGPDMFDYSKKYFDELLQTGTISEVRPADVWYDSRTDFSPAALGTVPASHPNEGFQLLQGPAKFSGKILGGCIDVIYDIFNNERFADTVELATKYSIFPSLEDWKGRILLLETSEEKPTPEKYRKMIQALKATGIFDVINGVLMGKPVDELYFDEYKAIITEEIGNPSLPIVANINIGHAQPRCILPFGVEALIDAENQVIRFSK